MRREIDMAEALLAEAEPSGRLTREHVVQMLARSIGAETDHLMRIARLETRLRYYEEVLTLQEPLAIPPGSSVWQHDESAAVEVCKVEPRKVRDVLEERDRVVRRLGTIARDAFHAGRGYEASRGGADPLESDIQTVVERAYLTAEVQPPEIERRAR